MLARTPVRTAILGASGYTGAETLRLLASHPVFDVVAVSAHSLAGKRMKEVFPHLADVCDLILQTPDEIDWEHIDLVFSCLPHGASQDVLLGLPDRIRIVDLSADFRFRDASVYQTVYGREHADPELTRTAVYGLTEDARERVSGARLVACPGCYPTASLLLLKPLLQAGLIETRGIIIDAKSGVSGAGRGVKEANLFSEVAEGLHAYAVGTHRHAPEIEQEASFFAGEDVSVSFTPHLVPMVRGELVTVYLDRRPGVSHEDIVGAARTAYRNEPFVSVADPDDTVPDTRHVRGTNRCRSRLLSGQDSRPVDRHRRYRQSGKGVRRAGCSERQHHVWPGRNPWPRNLATPLSLKLNLPRMQQFYVSDQYLPDVS